MSRRRKKRKLPPFVKPARGKFRAWWFDADGRERSKVFSTAEAAHAEAVRQRELALRPLSDRLTLQQGIDLVRKDLEIRGLENGTRRWYEDQFSALLKELHPGSFLDAMTPEDVERFAARRLNGTDRSKPVSPNSIRHHVRALGRIFRLAADQGAVTKDPTRRARLPKPVESKFDVFRWAEACSLLQRVAEAGGLEDADVISLLAHSGLRRAEVARLAMNDALEDKLEVRGKTGRRTLPVVPEMWQLLSRMRDRSSGEWLLPGDSEDNRIGYIRRALTRWQARLQEPRLHPHALRHTFASELARQGVAEHVIADLMGHARKRSVITQRYVSVFGDEHRRAMGLLWLSAT